MLLVVVIVAQQCSGMKIIQGYAVEIFADTFSERRAGGLKHGHEVDTVAYWSAVIMGGVRLGEDQNKGIFSQLIIFQLQHFLLLSTSLILGVKPCISCPPLSQSYFKSPLVSSIFSASALSSNLFPSSSSVDKFSFSSSVFKLSPIYFPQSYFQTMPGENILAAHSSPTSSSGRGARASSGPSLPSPPLSC